MEEKTNTPKRRKHLRVLMSLVLLTAASCGGGGGGGGGSTLAPPPTPTPVQYGSLAITQDNAVIVGLAVSFAEATLSLAQTAANEVVIFSTSSGSAYRECQFDGSATVTHVDADSSFSVSAGDSLTIEYDACFGDLVNGELTGTIEIAISQFQSSATSASVIASVDLPGGLRITDRVDPTLFSDVNGAMNIEFSLDPSENLAVTPSGNNPVSVTIDSTTESISDFDILRVTRADFPGAQSHEVDMDITFDFSYDSEFFGGTVTCETDQVFSFVSGNIGSANVLCRGQDSTAVNTRGLDLVSIDPEGDGSFASLGTIDWNLIIDGFLNEPSGLNLEVLLGQIATLLVSLDSQDIVYDAGRDRLLVATSSTDSFAPNAVVAVSISQNMQTVLETFGNEPSAIALSEDGALLYVGFTAFDEIRKYNAATMQLLSTVNIVSSDTASNQYGVLDLAVSPVASDTVAASFNYIGTGVDDVTVFANDVQLPGRYRNAPGGTSSAGEKLFFSEDGARIHSYYQPPPVNTGAQDMVIDDTGVAEAFSNYRFGNDLARGDGSIYSHASEYDAESYVLLGTFGWTGRHVAIDTVGRRFYSESYDTFEVWDLDRRLPIASYELGLDIDSVQDVEVAGDYVVFIRDDDLRLLDTALVDPTTPGACDATPLQTLEGDAYTQFACDVIDAIYDPNADRIYAAVSTDVPGNGNSVAVINANTSTVEDYIPVPSNPKRLVLSADGTRIYAIFSDVELLVAIDTVSQNVVGTWQLGIVTARTGYNEIEPRRALHIAASPLEPDTVVALMGEATNTLDKEFVAFRDGNRLANEVPISALKSNQSYPYPRVVFDASGVLYALHSDSTAPYFETLNLTPTGLTPSGTWFDAIGAIWWPFEVSEKGQEVYFAIGDVANLANQTVERRFDYNVLPFTEVNEPHSVFADPNSDDVWFLSQSTFMSTGLARFDDMDGSLVGADEFPFLTWGRNSDFSHASMFNVGVDKLGLVIDERQGVFVIDKAAIE